MSDIEARVLRIEQYLGLTAIVSPPTITGPITTAPAPPRVAPPAAEKPAPTGINYGPDLVMGSPSESRVYGIGAGSVTRWRYNGTGRLEFLSAGLSTNNAPPAVWVWLENTNRGYLTTPVRIGGNNTAPIPAIDVNGEVWFCEQIEAEPNTTWNRYAQVLPGAAAPTAGRGSVGPTGPAPR